MQTTKRLLGASRLPLTTKRGNKDYYKGTRQAFVPGESRRTGPPGRHTVSGKGKYKLVDEQVRLFVSPGAEALRTTELRPYVYTGDDLSPQERDDRLEASRFAREAQEPDPYPRPPPLPSFSPRLGLHGPISKTRKGMAKRQEGLSEHMRQSMIQQARRSWYEGMSKQFGKEVVLDKSNLEKGTMEPGAGMASAKEGAERSAVMEAGEAGR